MKSTIDVLIARPIRLHRHPSFDVGRLSMTLLEHAETSRFQVFLNSLSASFETLLDRVGEFALLGQFAMQCPSCRA